MARCDRSASGKPILLQRRLKALRSIAPAPAMNSLAHRLGRALLWPKPSSVQASDAIQKASVRLSAEKSIRSYSRMIAGIDRLATLGFMLAKRKLRSASTPPRSQYLHLTRAEEYRSRADSYHLLLPSIIINGLTSLGSGTRHQGCMIGWQIA